MRPAEPIRNVLLQPAALLAQVGDQLRNPLITRVVDGMSHANILDTHTRYSLSVYVIFTEDYMFQLIWLSGVAATALGIVFDMRRLRANHVGLPAAGWVFASACIGPVAGAAYLLQRRTARRALIDAAWELVGDANQPAHVRRERLIALERSGMLGAPIFRACLAVLDAEAAEPQHVMTEGDADRST
ncbi:hypothetical protein MAFF211519_27980 [Ralstonia pseudosolanacearum]|nr:hypothetical protein MAFF211519_27980 [Ralstonia pseudosolanacearum]